MTADRRLTLSAGVFYLLTFVTSMPALALKQPYLDGTTGADPDAVRWAAVLEIVLAVACVGTAVALYPVLRRHRAALALGFVASRTVEAAVIVLGVVGMLAVLTVGRSEVAAGALVAVHDWAFLLGPGLLPAVNALLLGGLLFGARLVPRAIPLVGLIGAPLLVVSALGTLLGWFDQVSLWGLVGALPIAIWELALGLWLTFRGLRDVTPNRADGVRYSDSGVAAR
ncbi:MAG: DUF4386 domain-containing protein [Micropruina sp.]|uniref:DUF4386 domain-containing protein n=1 Tax=Micropruina sp. TaxID=2737536 RepID=UPI0039E313C9